MTPQEWIKDTLNRWPAGHHVAEGATHLAAALEEIAERGAEIARLRAEAGRVVVPELTPDGMSTAAFVEGYRFAASRARSVPSSRILKDGEVAVDAEEWAAMCDLGFDPVPCCLDHHGFCQEHNWFSEKPCPTAILQRLYALRAQATATESGEKGGA